MEVGHVVTKAKKGQKCHHNPNETAVVVIDGIALCEKCANEELPGWRQYLLK